MTIYNNERMNTLRELEQRRCKPTFMVVIEKDLIFIIPLRFSPDADQVQSHSRPFCSHTTNGARVDNYAQYKGEG